jgi:hypothetical protein
MQDLSDKLPDSFLIEAMKIIDTEFQDCPDLIKRQVSFNNTEDAYFIYLKYIVNEENLQQNFIVPLLSQKNYFYTDENIAGSLPSSNLKTTKDLNVILQELLSGSALFISQSTKFATIYSTPKKIERSIQEPATEKNIKGAHDGFTESLETNMGIIRMKLQNPKLKSKQLKVGTISNLNINVVYLDGVADVNALEGLVQKIGAIKMESVPAVGYIAKVISTTPNSPLQQVQLTERPDKAVSALIEGRFVIILDSVPNVLIAPVTFFSFFETMDDYGRSWFLGAFLRIIRYIAVLITISLPSLYLAFTGFHYYMIPIALITTLAQSRSKVPFPPVIEILILEFAIEVLREATIRLPTYIGMTIGVVGGIVIGQAAVDAGIISNLLLIVVGFTAICGSVLPSYDIGLGIRFIRFVCLLFTSLFGIIGMAVFSMLFFAHLVTLESLGQPYFKLENPFKLSRK